MGSCGRSELDRQASPTPDRRQYEYYRCTGTTESSHLLPTPTWEPRHGVRPLIESVDRSRSRKRTIYTAARERWMIKGRKKEEEEGVGMRSVERAENARQLLRFIVFVIMRRCTAIESNVPPGTCCEKMRLSGIFFWISLEVLCICCIDKGAILIQVSRVERYNKIGSFGIWDTLSCVCMRCGHIDIKAAPEFPRFCELQEINDFGELWIK